MAQVFTGTTAASLRQRYFYGSGNQPTPLAEETPADPSLPMRWLVSDDQGTWVEVADNSFNVQQAFFYDPFGNLIAEQGTGEVPRFQYEGQEYDQESNLYHFDHRYYDPVRGRFMTQDPTGLGPDANPYRFANNDPVDLTDPTGLFATPLGWNFGAGTGPGSPITFGMPSGSYPATPIVVNPGNLPPGVFSPTLYVPPATTGPMPSIGGLAATLPLPAQVQAGIDADHARLDALSQHSDEVWATAQQRMAAYETSVSQARLSADFAAADAQHTERAAGISAITTQWALADDAREANNEFLAYQWDQAQAAAAANKVFGAIQFVGSLGEIAVGTLASATGWGALVGAPTMAHGGSSAYAAWNQMMTGRPQISPVAQVIMKTGVSRDTAQVLDGLAGVALTAGSSAAGEFTTLARAEAALGESVSVPRTAAAAVPDLSQATFFPVSAGRAIPRAPFAADFYETLVRSLPAYDASVGRTTGILATDEGLIYRLQSGDPIPAFANYAIASHVEGKAAIQIGVNNSTGGILFHNFPEGTCNYCYRMTPTLLPQGATLDIVPAASNWTATPKPYWYNYPVTREGSANLPLLNRRLGLGIE